MFLAYATPRVSALDSSSVAYFIGA